jgi:predicted RNA binding protein YcfA (HicA-like mRNA interferase family)
VSLKDLPVAPGERHVAAFVRAGWSVVRQKGSHRILERDGYENHLSVPCTKKDLSRALLDGLIEAAGMDHASYCEFFHKRVPRVKLESDDA